jgi:hypothetical protein
MLNSVISQKIELSITSAVRTSDPTVATLTNVICHVTVYPMVRVLLILYILFINDERVRH